MNSPIPNKHTKETEGYFAYKESNKLIYPDATTDNTFNTTAGTKCDTKHNAADVINNTPKSDSKKSNYDDLTLVYFPC